MGKGKHRSSFFTIKAFVAYILLLIILFGVGATVYLSQQKTVEPPSFAASGACSGGEDDFQGCSNGGNISNGCNWICNTAPPGVQLVAPPCCQTLVQTGDPFACCFDARRRCTPQQCSAIPEGVAKQRCGQLWELGYCGGSGGGGTTPKPTNPPNTPKPTRRPKPTQVPTVVPTTPTHPSKTVVPPTSAPQPTATQNNKTPSPVPTVFTSIDQGSLFPTPNDYATNTGIFDIPNVLGNFLSTFLFGYQSSDPSNPQSLDQQSDHNDLEKTNIFLKTQQEAGKTWGFFIDLSTKIAP